VGIWALRAPKVQGFELHKVDAFTATQTLAPLGALIAQIPTGRRGYGKEDSRGEVIQGYLAHTKIPPPKDPPRTLGIGYGRVLGGCCSL